MREGARLLLVRHGRHDWLDPATNRLAGRLPGVHLNGAGRAEVAALGERLAVQPPDRIASSPLERTLETAQIIGERVGRSIIVDARLIETYLGPWEGMPVPEVMAKYPEAWRLWRTAPTRLDVPGFEPVEALADRMLGAALEYLALGGSTLLVSHQDPLLALICRLLDLPLDAMRRMEVSTGSLTVFEVANARPVLVVLNSRAFGTAPGQA
jgi:probable phosphoglycerate mutase